MKKTIKCLIHYDTPESKERRNYSPAAAAKAEYLFSCFHRLGYRAEVLSASQTEETPGKGSVRELEQGILLETLPSSGRGNGLHNALSTLFFRLTLYLRLLRFLQEGDTLWVYHSLPLMGPLRVLKRLRKFTLILEMEELYGDVLGSKGIRNREIRFARLADGFLFPTEELNSRVNAGNKPYVVCHGPYRVNAAAPVSKEKGVHVVYAGSAAPEKGAFLAMDAAEYLPEGYHVHILTADTPAIRNHLARKHCKCTLGFHGILQGKAFMDLLGICRVGLCTQNPAAAFNDTSFPSKILTYLGSGLQVVCARIPAVEHSGVGAHLRYYEEPTPHAVAEAIVLAAEKQEEGRPLLQTLDEAFLKAMEELLENLG